MALSLSLSDLEVAEAAARRAGELLLAGFGSDHAVRRKSASVSASP